MSYAPRPRPTPADLAPIRMTASIARPPEDPRPEAADPAMERLAYRLDEIARSLGVSRRLIERERAAGRFPKPDLTMGRAPLWTRETLTRWIAQGGGRPC
jgi:predicted DNA-binding transcriptional regulator AlpA